MQPELKSNKGSSFIKLRSKRGRSHNYGVRKDFERTSTEWVSGLTETESLKVRRIVNNYLERCNRRPQVVEIW
jgi:hypothetical protein